MVPYAPLLPSFKRIHMVVFRIYNNQIAICQDKIKNITKIFISVILVIKRLNNSFFTRGHNNVHILLMYNIFYNLFTTGY